MDYLSFTLTCTDYNAPSPDILFALRDTHQSACPFLTESAFGDLAENYAAEEPEDFLDALGQELICFQHAHYELENDSDSYALTIISEDRIEEFKAKLKVQKQKAQQRKQARRKAGTPAKRINLGKRLPCDKWKFKYPHILFCFSEYEVGVYGKRRLLEFIKVVCYSI